MMYSPSRCQLHLTLMAVSVFSVSARPDTLKGLHPCAGPPDKGPCNRNIYKWAYSHELEECIMFSWGGCGGNDKNRFDGEKQCLDRCSAKKSFLHPGLLHTENDFIRIKDALNNNNNTVTERITGGWNKLIANKHAATNQKARAVAVVYRGQTSWMTDAGIKENYPQLFNDAASAYALAIRWKITGNESYAITATTILDAWSNTLHGISGSSDKYLAAGIYGYQLANAGEILRDYAGWNGTAALQKLLLNVFYVMNHDFITNHNGHGAADLHYWANWDLAQLASMIAIGIFSDRSDIYNEAIDYIKSGKGNGAFNHAMWKIYKNERLAQIQESGRDQGHATLDVSLIGIICQMAYNQGEDLFAFNDNLVLKGAEYVAKYNLGYDVPFTTYTNGEVTQDKISDTGRGTFRPMWELLYNHYVVLKGLKANYIQQFAEKVRPEGGGGDYGPNSGGFDQLGYGTLLYTLNTPSP